MRLEVAPTGRAEAGGSGDLYMKIKHDQARPGGWTGGLGQQQLAANLDPGVLAFGGPSISGHLGRSRLGPIGEVIESGAAGGDMGAATQTRMRWHGHSGHPGKADDGKAKWMGLMAPRPKGNGPLADPRAWQADPCRAFPRAPSTSRGACPLTADSLEMHAR